MMMASPFQRTLSAFHIDSEPVMDFDDSDLMEKSVEYPAILEEETRKVVPHLKQSVLIGSLLEQLCSLHEKDKNNSKRLYFLLCDQLLKLGIISPVAYLPEFTSVRTEFKKTLYDLIKSSVCQLNIKSALSDKTRTLDDGSSESCDKPFFIDPKKVFDFDLSRYTQDFIEKGRLGTGGYGNVFQAQSKIDGQDYAVKKIILRVPDNDSYADLLREVHVLATLKHKNIVRYHSAWLEHSQEPRSRKGFSEKSFTKAEFAYKRETSSNGFLKHDLQTIPQNTNSDDPNSNEYSWCDSFPNGASPDCSHSFLVREENSTSSDVFPSDVACAHECRLKKSRSKFYDSSSNSSVGSKKMFYVSPTSSDEENEDLQSWQQRNEKGDFEKMSVRFETPAGTPPQDVILTHGVKRDLHMRKVKSFIVTKDSLRNGFEGSHIHCFFNTDSKRSHSLTSMTDNYQSADRKAALALFKAKSTEFGKLPAVESKLVLYIQMELCHTSLKRWLSARNRNIHQKAEAFQENVSLHIMKQIVCALEFIHSKGLIHRDVKPPNIFVNDVERPHILLGDFGLARTDLTRSDSTDTAPMVEQKSRPFLSRNDSHTSGVGTTTYAAPEQLARIIYDSKVDMYSFGIVVFELWNPFGTVMERAEQLKQLRACRIPSDFTDKFPELSELIASLISHNPSVRPSATEILASNFFEKSKDKVIKEQARRIEALQNEKEALQNENEELRRLLQLEHRPQ